MPRRRASLSKTSMKVSPMARRLSSGSIFALEGGQEGRRWRRRSGGCLPRPSSSNMRTTPAVSSLRIRPLSTCSSCSRSGPRASAKSLAATVESTPPEASRNTEPSPTWARIRSICVLDEAVHGPGGPAAADAQHEVGDHPVAVQGVVHLGMELEAVAAQLVAADGGEAVGLGALVQQAVAQLLEVRARRRSPSRSGSSTPARPGPGPRTAGCSRRMCRSAWPHSCPPLTTVPP